MFKKKKIHYANLASVEVHKAPFSFLFDIGNIEISNPNEEIIMVNIYKPFEIKEKIMELKKEFQNKQ
jgi:hypothetical protein